MGMLSSRRARKAKEQIIIMKAHDRDDIFTKKEGAKLLLNC